MPRRSRELSRRNWRKNRPQLEVGASGLSGIVVKWLPTKNCGFIQPDCGAARIFFHFADVPRHREKCVGVGRKVFFAVEQGKKDTVKARVL